jgi:hypothetical protein
LRQTKLQWFESFNEGTLNTLVLKRNANSIDSLLAIIGPADRISLELPLTLKLVLKLRQFDYRRSKAATTETVAPVAQEESTDGKKNSSPLAKKLPAIKGQLNQVKGSGEMDAL